MMDGGVKYDVVIVGSGVSGAIVALQLGLENRKVLILEAGPPVPASRETYMERFYTSADKMPESPYPPNTLNSNPASEAAGRATTLDLINVADPSKSYLVQNLSHGHLPFSSTYERIGGGTLWHWLGTSLRLLPGDFEMRSRYGRGRDWPIDYEAMQPFYAAAEAEMGVACDKDTQLYMKGLYPNDYVYPMPGVVPSLVDATFAAGLKGLELYGQPMQVAPTPAGRNTIPYQDRRVCAGNTNCIPICPIQAKYDATVTLNKALNTGNVTIQYKSVASRVVVDGATGRIGGIDYMTYTDPRGGATGSGTAVGDFYVLAAHAIETPRLLLMSATDEMPKGVANSSDQVGRNLMDHPLYLSWALMPDGQPVYPMRGPMASSGIETLRDTPHRKDWAAFRIEIGNTAWAFPINDPYTTTQDFIDGTNASGLNPDGARLHGRALIDRLNGLMTRQIRMSNLVEQQAQARNRVSVAADHVDGLGLPRPRIDYTLSDYTRQGFRRAREVNSRIYRQLGAREYSTVDKSSPSYFEVDGQGFDFYGAGHIMGTHLMGSSSKDSVLDRDMRSWDHPNLFMVGSGAFPSSGTGNPTLTVAALSFKAAGTLLRELKK
jgi:choline dehydrogenase-like flavoprotein